MLNLNSFLLGSDQPKVLGAFYEKIFGKPSEMPDMDSPEEGWFSWQVGNSYLSVGPHSEVKGKAKEPQRVMFNLETTQVKEEFDRLIKAGAESVKAPYEIGGGWIATLADPDGNYFQLVTPWKDE